MKKFNKELIINSSKRIEFIDITSKISQVVKESRILDGICYIFVPHTTAAITINENFDYSVRQDIINKINNLIAKDEQFYKHLEGNSDAHIKSSIFGVSINIFVNNGNLSLGSWQGVFFCEFDGPRQRKLLIKILGD